MASLHTSQCTAGLLFSVLIDRQKQTEIIDSGEIDSMEMLF